MGLVRHHLECFASFLEATLLVGGAVRFDWRAVIISGWSPVTGFTISRTDAGISGAGSGLGRINDNNDVAGATI